MFSWYSDIFFGTKFKKKWLDLWLTRGWLVTRGWLGLAVGSCNATTHFRAKPAPTCIVPCLEWKKSRNSSRQHQILAREPDSINYARQDTEDKTKQDKTRQDKTRQDRTREFAITNSSWFHNKGKTKKLNYQHIKIEMKNINKSPERLVKLFENMLKYQFEILS